MTKRKKAYVRAGVDVDLANKLKRGIGAFVTQTHGPQLLGKIGGFGGLCRARFPTMRDPVRKHCPQREQCSMPSRQNMRCHRLILRGRARSHCAHMSDLKAS